MAGDTTIFEAPITPAPVFAYRALRGLFFTSPDSSPEQVAHNNKENIPAIHLSPSKSFKDDTITISTTPLRNRNNVNCSSPTKSILRTPGLVTPRTRKLREVNVKFKSVSPEVLAERLSSGANKVQEEIIATEKTNIYDKNNSAIVHGPTRPLHEKGTTSHLSHEARDECIPSITQSPSAGFDVEGYMERTEREMKKLVRYGQKMREYARKQDEENIRLKKLVAELQQENRRLSQTFEGDFPSQMRSISDGKASAKDTKGKSKRQHFDKVITSTTAVSDMPFHPKGQSHPKPSQPRMNTVGNAVTSQPHASSSQTALHNSRPTLKQSEPSQECVRLNIPSLSSSSSSTNMLSHATKPKTAKPSSNTQDPQTSTPQRSNQTSDGNHPQRLTSNSSIEAAGSARLTVDRVMAARERLRRKAELRKTSVESDRDVGPGGGDSQVDWAGL